MTPADLDRMEKIAREAAQAAAGDWTAYQNPFAPDKQQWDVVGQTRDHDVAEAVPFNIAAHVATFDPPTVLSLITRLRQLEGAVERAQIALVICVLDGNCSIEKVGQHNRDIIQEALDECRNVLKAEGSDQQSLTHLRAIQAGGGEG